MNVKNLLVKSDLKSGCGRILESEKRDQSVKRNIGQRGRCRSLQSLFVYSWHHEEDVGFHTYLMRLMLELWFGRRSTPG